MNENQASRVRWGYTRAQEISELMLKFYSHQLALEVCALELKVQAIAMQDQFERRNYNMCQLDARLGRDVATKMYENAVDGMSAAWAQDAQTALSSAWNALADELRDREFRYETWRATTTPTTSK